MVSTLMRNANPVQTQTAFNALFHTQIAPNVQMNSFSTFQENAITAKKQTATNVEMVLLQNKKKTAHNAQSDTDLTLMIVSNVMISIA